jgi:hypothetical protein
MSYENFFREHDRKKKEEEERKRQEEERRWREEALRRQEEERKRQEEEKRRKEVEERRKLQIASRFDAEIKLVLQGYGNAKMKSGIFSTKRVDGPTVTSSGAYWSLRCAGYQGVEITLHFKSNARGELEPDYFSISGTWGGRSRASLSIQDLLNALADSQPEKYSPPSSYSDHSSCVCNMGIC